MRSFQLLAFTILTLMSLILSVSPNQAETDIRIVLDGESQIIAGETWSLMISVEGLEVGDTVQGTMLHGLAVYTSDLQLGTGGITLWEFETETLTQAGISHVVVSKNGYSQGFLLEIRPKELTHLQSFATANSLIAYGDDATSLISFASDMYGNPIDNALLTIQKTSPSGENRLGFVLSRLGLATQPLTSMGNPGILRVTVSHGAELSVPLTMVQLAGQSSEIDLQLSPTCVLSDGLDSITLTATVRDRHGFNITDGQVVSFTWASGGGTRITVDGTASITIPPPRTLGSLTYSVTNGLATASQILEVKERCDD